METGFSEGYIEAGSAMLHYHCYGSGPPLVMLHGNRQNSSFFRRQITAFQELFQVITIDSRGHGESSFGSRRLSIDVMSEDVVEALDQLGIGKSIFLGFSDGGNVALNLAVKFPDRFRALIVIGANLAPHGLKPFIRIPVRLAYHTKNLTRGRSQITSPVPK